MGRGRAGTRPLIPSVRLARPAEEDFRRLDRRTRRAVAAAISALGADPHRGKPLTGALVGYRSVRAAGARYRIVYRIEPDVLVIVAIGARRPGDQKDVYAQLARLLAERS